MIAVNHSAIAAAGTSLILGIAAPIALSLTVLGSQLPDLDTTTSIKVIINFLKTGKIHNLRFIIQN